MTHRSSRLAIAAASSLGLGLVAFIAPAVVAAHSLDVTYSSPLPLAVYLAGAAMTVALSFAFVLVRDVRATPVVYTDQGFLPPAPIRIGLRVLGLVAWAWIVAQGVIGGSSAAEVATLFLWVYGWVGLALVSAFVGPAWHFLDPFSTLFDIGAWAVRKAGIGAWEPAEYPSRLGRWPAVIGFAAYVWLELCLDGGGSSTLFIVLIGYTVFTLSMMAQFGRDTWRSNGETFTVWFRLLGRLAFWALVDESGRIRRRPFASGLLEPGWTRPDVTLVALGVGSILYDGLSQTEPFYGVFGFPAVGEETLIMSAFLAIIVIAAFVVVRFVGVAATGAGLLPIAIGYLVAHYLTYLLIDGQRIVVAFADPFQQGWDLGGFGWAFHEPSGAFLPPGLVWTLQLAAVVGGHMVGAWGGHVAAAADAPRGIDTGTLRMRQVPLAVAMVALTTLTLWSLGQAIVVNPDEVASLATQAASLG